MTIEEAWAALGPDRYGIKLEARALAQAVLEDMELPCCGVMDEDDPAWCGNPRCLQAVELRQRIENLGLPLTTTPA